MEPMHLPDVEKFRPQDGPLAEMFKHAPPGSIAQIMHLFAWKPEATRHLQHFTQAVMRGASELPPGKRELIAAFVSGKNQCLF
jgi:alkylhydroperoxidase family enzyme